ncbi:hypothetical protein BURMUCF2_A1139 [Burkholderia multivorans CF2]|nr:hypothetical protein BURMUCF2_A1139 [Burkholderia multivorans CF2]
MGPPGVRERLFVHAGRPDCIQREGIRLDFNVGPADARARVVPAARATACDGAESRAAAPRAAWRAAP